MSLLSEAVVCFDNNGNVCISMMQGRLRKNSVKRKSLHESETEVEVNNFRKTKHTKTQVNEDDWCKRPGCEGA